MNRDKKSEVLKINVIFKSFMFLVYYENYLQMTYKLEIINLFVKQYTQYIININNRYSFQYVLYINIVELDSAC